MAEKAKVEMTGSGILRFRIAWFRPEDWSELKAICSDLQDTYDEWLSNAEAGVKALGLGPYDFEKVILTPDILRDWQATNGGEINSKVRGALAIEIAKRKDTRH